jgi:hypothetical protein
MSDTNDVTNARNLLTKFQEMFPKAFNHQPVWKWSRKYIRERFEAIGWEFSETQAGIDIYVNVKDDERAYVEGDGLFYVDHKSKQSATFTFEEFFS